MDLEHLVGIRTYGVEVGRKARGEVARLFAAARVVLGLYLPAPLAGVVYRVIRKDASLRLKVRHSLRRGQVSQWVDGDLAYAGNLVGSAKRKFGLIPFGPGESMRDATDSVRFPSWRSLLAGNGAAGCAFERHQHRIDQKIKTRFSAA